MYEPVRSAFGLVLAGGEGRRLGHLTRARCKPALPFGGGLRSIDFTLSNCINSGLRNIAVLTQYCQESLIPHLEGWRRRSSEGGPDVRIWQARAGTAGQYVGTADAVYKNLSHLRQSAAQYAIVLAADHVYRMDYGELLRTHVKNKADVTIACSPVSRNDVSHYGILTLDEARVAAFVEKPLTVEHGVAAPLASMGVYVFGIEFLCELLEADATRTSSRHDFGGDILTDCVRAGDVRVCAHRFRDPCTGEAGYWRDIGTVDTYWEANMDFLRRPPFNADDRRWPVGNVSTGEATFCELAAPPVIGGTDEPLILRSVLAPGVRVGKRSIVENCVLFPGARIGADCRLRNVIIGDDVIVPERCEIDGARARKAPGCDVSPGGIGVLWRTPRATWRRRGSMEKRPRPGPGLPAEGAARAAACTVRPTST